MADSPPRIAVLTIRPPLERSDLPGLVRRTCVLLASYEQKGFELLLCEVEGLDADAVALDALAQLALAARRRGCSARLSGASVELVELVELIGLSEVLGH